MSHENKHQLPETGFLRLRGVLGLFPVSRSSWFAGVAEGRYPAPVKLGPRMSAWKVEDIRELIAKLGHSHEKRNPQPFGQGHGERSHRHHAGCRPRGQGG